MRCIDGEESKTVGGGASLLPLSVAVATGGALSIGATGCVAGGLAGPGGVLIGCGIGAIAGLAGGAVIYLVETANSQ